MPLFRCMDCGSIENTALSNYWTRGRFGHPDGRPLCSACDPTIGQWHGAFEQRSAEGMFVDAQGFLFASQEEARSRNARCVARIVDGREVGL